MFKFLLSSLGSGGAPGGVTTQLQYNSLGALAGISGVTSNGTLLTSILLGASVVLSWNGLAGINIDTVLGPPNFDFGDGSLNNKTGILNFAAANTTGVYTNTQSIAAVSTDGLVLKNTTAAAAGAQQWSPRIRLTGQGWKTTAVAASQSLDWMIENVPVQGSTAPTSTLIFSLSTNGGAAVNVFKFDSLNTRILTDVTANVVATSQPTIQIAASLNMSNGSFSCGGNGTASMGANVSGSGILGNNLGLNATMLLSWSSAGNAAGVLPALLSATDTNLNRVSAGILAVGTTAANALGSLNLLNLTATGVITVPGAAVAALTSTATFTSGAGAGAGTITNAPSAGNPTSWIKINDNGTTRYVPAW